MIADANQLSKGSKLSCEICIVGAGVAGITFAREFANTNTDIILLESGGLKPDPVNQQLNEGDNVGFPYFELDKTRARAFGGTSHLWNINVKRDYRGVRLRSLDEIDFEKREWIPYSGWPFRKTDLEPYYERAHQVFQLGPYTYKSQDWVEGNEKPSLPFIDDKVRTTIFQFARSNIFYSDYKEEIENANNIRSFLHATVIKLRTTENARQVKSVEAITPQGTAFSIEANYFILALGGLETPRLLLLSNDSIKDGLGNQNDLVGRFFMEHPHYTRNSGKFYPTKPGSFRKPSIYDLQIKNGVPILGYFTLSDEVIRAEQLLNFTVRISGKNEWRIKGLEEGISSFKTMVSDLSKGKKPENFFGNSRKVLSNIDSIAYAVIRKFVNGDVEKWNKMPGNYSGISLGIMSEQIPDPESRVMLGRETDHYSLPKIQLKWKLNSIDIKTINRSLEIIDTELRKAELGHLEFGIGDHQPPEELQGGYHHMGTTRMHENPKYGVVDEHCSAHGTENLFIAGSSVFPTVGYANPTLTIVALTLRLADHMKNILK